MITNEAKEVILSIGDQQITSKNCMITECNIQTENHSDVYTVWGKRESAHIQKQQETTITLELKCFDMEFQTWLYGEKLKPKINKKLVKDCTISELLFAVRNKINK